MKDKRLGIDNDCLQEVLDAAVSVGHALQRGQSQFQSPEWLSRGMAALLPYGTHSNALDPQAADGNLLLAINTSLRLGIEIDKRKVAGELDAMREEINLITGSCVHVAELIDEFHPHFEVACIVANPPFAIRWLVKNEKGEEVTEDSTEWTWRFIKRRLANNGCGFLISNAATLERLKIVEDPMVFLSQKFPAGGVWPDCSVELGIVHFIKGTSNETTREHKAWTSVPTEEDLVAFAKERNARMPYYYRPYCAGNINYAWSQLTQIVKEETLDRPKHNIFLNKEGMLRTYLSTRAQLKMPHHEIAQLSRINHTHPLVLTTERETRKLMSSYLVSGVYTIEPAARAAIEKALADVASLACPIRPVTDFELVAYADEEEHLRCRAVDPNGKVMLTVGKLYEVRTGTYGFVDRFTRKKIFFDEERETTEIEDHDCELRGEDRYIEITADRGRMHRFMEKPIVGRESWQHPEAWLWDLFERPLVLTVAEVHGEKYDQCKEVMKFNELLAGFTYFPGQLEYYARMGCKDYGLVAAATGTGKTLGALTLVALKSPLRTLIIAPQGTMRSSGEEDDIEYQAAQWVMEIERFAPGEPVFQLFSREDWRNILHANAGELPPGIYITYPQAYFNNGAFETIPNPWKDSETEQKFCERLSLPYDEQRSLEDLFSRHVGTSNKHGIRCIAEPSLATLMATHHGEWDMVILDEAHLITNPSANISQALIRLQPRIRFALTATPIFNIVSNIFNLMGWLCVKDWFKGKRRNAAWPYACDEIGRFNSTFLSTEIDLTAQRKARAQGKRRSQVGVKFSPVISSPARLLKLLKSNLAYISKEDCNPDLKPCHVIDVRVALGKEQAKLYAYWLERRNYLAEFKNPLTIAGVQLTRLRGVCAAPASLDYTRDMCKSNFNPKTVTILGLVRDCLAKGEPVVVVSARVGQSQSLATRLSDAGISIARIDNTVPADLHSAEANRFKKGDARVMLMGIKCAQGHSFECCPNLIVGSLEWSYGTLHQAQGRVWRLNSPKDVTVWCVLHKNTIEELLFERVALKQDAATLCLHGKRVPRDFKTLDATEVLAEHIVNYDAGDGEILSESECESQWPDLRKQLVMANRGQAREGAA